MVEELLSNYENPQIALCKHQTCAHLKPLKYSGTPMKCIWHKITF